MKFSLSLAAACVAALCTGNTFAQFAGVAVDNGVTATTYTESGAVSRPTSGNGSAPVIYAGDGLGSDSALTVSGTRINADLYQASGDSSSLHVTQSGSQLLYRQATTGLTSTVVTAPQGTFIGTTDGTGRLTSGLASDGTTGQNTLTGNTTVNGNLAVAASTTTNGIDNSGKRISNVAAGQATTDAANVGQLNEMSNSQAVVNQGQAAANANQAAANANQATINTNQAAFNANQANTNAAMQSQTADNRKVASTGTSIAVAAASIPALEQGKNFGFGAGTGTYDGRAAIALGFAARISEALQIKLNIGTGSGGRVGAGAGGLWSW